MKIRANVSEVFLKFKKILFTFLLLTAALALAQFQNCADVKLSSVYKLTSIGNITGKFCATNFNNPPNAPIKYAVKNFFVTNLNAKVEGNQIKADSDADGLSDDFENNSSSPTYSATNRRTFGTLDSICAASGGTGCEYTGLTAAISTGLLESDLFGFSAAGVGLGYDADLDGIPDLLEILKSTDIVRDDVLNDNDLDGKNNLKEVQQALDANSADDLYLPPQFQTITRYWLSDLYGGNGVCPTGQKMYEFSVDNIPLVPTQAFTAENVEEEYLSHSQAENLILLSYVSESEGTSPQREYYTQIIRVNIKDASKIKITTTPSQFNFQGQY
ncbi:MAG: hypothetical protein IPM57_12210 [Oligoflexia bacterium]|nr:hypothetical protein [Oligoflexia bacterium]